jgi:hypothetical protein
MTEAKDRGDMTEVAAAEAAEARGWTLEKRGKVFRLVAENGTVVAGDWTQPDELYFGLTLTDVAKALEP